MTWCRLVNVTRRAVGSPAAVAAAGSVAEMKRLFSRPLGSAIGFGAGFARKGPGDVPEMVDGEPGSYKPKVTVTSAGGASASNLKLNNMPHRRGLSGTDAGGFGGLAGPNWLYVVDQVIPRLFTSGVQGALV